MLDLFAGSGALGLEALSRGAAAAVFVENDREAFRTIDRNIEKLRVSGARVVQQDVLQALATDHGTYDLVLCDPPYDYAQLDVKDKEGRTAMTWAEGVFLATHPSRPKPSTIALITELIGKTAATK